MYSYFPRVVQISLTVGAVIIIGVIAWQLAGVILLFFAAVLFAIVLQSLSGLIERIPAVKKPWSLLLATLLIAAAAALFFLLLGSQIQSQVTSLIKNFPQYISTLGNQLGMENLNERLEQWIAQFSGGNNLLTKIAGYTSGTVGVFTSLFLVLVAAIYLAAHPDRYLGGFLKMIPEKLMPEVESLLHNMGHALRLWLFGQLVSMGIVGAVVTLSLYIIGLPSALVLGIFAGLAEFIPIVGPIIAAFPIILVALSQNMSTVYWVIFVYIVIQLLESYLVVPQVQRRVVELPPVITIFSIVAFGALFGPLGILLGTPLAVVVYVAVNQLYIRNTLGKDTEVPGQNTP